MHIIKLSQCLTTLVLLLYSITSSLAESPSSQTVMVLGDSLSSGYQIKQGKNWVSLLQQCINNMHEDVLIINESIENDTTSSSIKRFPESLTAYQPDVVIIALGTNDQLTHMSNSDTINNLQQMIHLSQQNDAQVLLIGSPIHTIKQQQLFKELSLQKNIPFIKNLYMELEKDSTDLMSDELHANTQAQQTIMNTIWKQLFPILGL